MGKDPGVALISALARIWQAIRRRHPDVPPVVLLPAPAQRGRMNVLGHFAALRWAPKAQEGGHLHEVVVVAEHLDRSAEDIIKTLLHEAAHARNFERGIRDCSRSQYHNRAFKTAAEEVGLTVMQVPHYGFAATQFAEGTIERYRAEADALATVLVHRRKPAHVRPVGGTPGGAGDDAPTGTSRNKRAACACPYVIRVSRKTLAATTIRCETCGEPFRLKEKEDDGGD